MLKNAKKIGLGFGKNLKKTVAGGLCTAMIGLTPFCAYADGTANNFYDDEFIGAAPVNNIFASGNTTFTVSEGLLNPVTVTVTGEGTDDLVYTGETYTLSHSLSDSEVVNSSNLVVNGAVGNTVTDAGTYYLSLNYEYLSTTYTDGSGSIIVLPASLTWDVTSFTENFTHAEFGVPDFSSVSGADLFGSFTWGASNTALNGTWTIETSSEDNCVAKFTPDDDEKISNFDFASLGFTCDTVNNFATIPLTISAKPFLQLRNQVKFVIDQPSAE